MLFLYGVIGATLGVSIAVLVKKAVVALFGKSAVSIGISYSLLLLGVIVLLSTNHSKVESFVSSIMADKEVSFPATQQGV